MMQKERTGRIILENHHEYAAVADVVRQFFGNIQPENSVFTIPATDDFIITCTSSEELSPDLIRKANRAELSELETAVLPREFELRVELSNLGGKWVWREQTTPLNLRRSLRRLLHKALSAQTEISFPWGSLLGVRPTQVALAVLDQGRQQDSVTTAAESYSDAEKIHAQRELEEHWGVSQPKAALAVETAEAEHKLLSTIDSAAGDYIAYVGLPFCPSRCNYCSFITESALAQAGLLDEYVAAVITESTALFSFLKRPPRAVYFGGGTPTSLADNLFDRYVKSVVAAVPQAEEIEYTMEAGRPDTINAAKLKSSKEAGFNKICINPQSMIDETLAAVGRRHSVADTVTAFKLAREAGFTDINMDLIAGLPGDRRDGFLYSLERVLELEPESITLHTLSVKRGAFLDEDGQAGDPFLPQVKLIRQMEAAQEQLRKSGYKPYYLYRQRTARSGLENIAFTKKAGSLYNVAMMSDAVPVLGLGSGATTKSIHDGVAERIYNPKDLKSYIERIDSIIEKKIDFFAKHSFINE